MKVLIYHLYGLMYEEVKVVDEGFWMSESEYNRVGNEDVMLVFENMNHEVQEMYELVNKATPNKLNAIIKRYNITSVKEFNRLLAI